MRNITEKKPKKKRLRGFPGVVKGQLDALNTNAYFQEKYQDEKFKVLLNANDGKLAAIVKVENGVVEVESVKNIPKENIKKKQLGWDGKLDTTVPIFLEIAMGKLSLWGIIKKVITRKIKIRGIRTLLKLLDMFNILAYKGDK